MTRRTALAGVAVAGAFLVLAWVSAAWSPLGRGPVLDGLGPLAPYRWVNPPPGATDDGAPLSASFELAVDVEGSEPDVLLTPDDQVTLVMDRGAIGPEPGLRSVTIDVTPLDPASLGRLPGDLTAFGNAVRIDAGGVVRFNGQVDVVLLYPETVSLHATRHEILWSVDGDAWRPLDTTDNLATQQAQATIEAPGYVVVGAVPVPHPSATATGEPEDIEDTSTPIVVAIAIAGAIALIGVGIAVRLRARRT